MSKCVMILLHTTMLIAMVLSAPPPPPSQTPPSQTPPSSPAKAYLLALQWPASVCLVEQCKDRPDPLPSSFKLHGLWPCNTGWGRTVENCPGPDFSGNALEDMRPDLRTYWPSLIEPENEFWEHEWVKHGRCSGLPLTHYFGDGVRLTQINARRIKSALVKEGIKPGRSTTATPVEIRTAIAKNFGFRPQITCGTNNNNFLLKEIHLCMDQNFKFQDCPTQGWLQRCGRYQNDGITPVRFPDS